MRVAIRGFIGGQKQFEDRVTVPPANLEELARKHTEALADFPHMIEVEFLDEPNPLERFFRFGTDPRGMVAPVGIDLTKRELN